ncbi:MAG: DUF3857 domain-containing protein, partial [Terriglobales bacterium]
SNAAPAALLAAAAPYLADPARLRDDPAQFPAEGAVELYHLRYEQVLSNGLSASVVQRVFQIRTAAAADLFALDDLWYDTARNRFQLRSAQVLRAGPGARAVTALSGEDLGDLRANASGNQPRRVGLPQLRAGDCVSVLYLLLPDTVHDWRQLGGHYLGNLFAFRDSFPTLASRYVVASAAPLASSAVGVAPALRSRSAAGLDTWAWEAGPLPAFFSSPDGPSITDRSPFVQVSGFSSWAAMAGWYSNLLARQARLGPALERRLLATAGDLALRTPADPAAVRATVARVWAYLSAHLAYRGDESGLHAYVPAAVGEIFQSGQGDCKDGALLLATWLRAAGVEADLALVRTPAMGQLAPVRSDGEAAATMAAFDHALVYLPATQQWIDTTAPSFLSGELPASDQDSMALIVRAGQNELVRVPSAPVSANLTRRSVRLTPSGAGWLEAVGEIEVRGADAPAMRVRYADAGNRGRELELWLRNEFAHARVESVQVAGVDPPSDTVRIGFRARIPLPGTGTETGAAPLSVSWTRTHYARLLAAQVERSEPLELPLRWRLDETWTLEQAPCGLLRAVPPTHHSSPFGELAIRSSCERGALTVQSDVTQSARQIAPAEYGAFRAFWQSVDAALDAPAPAAQAAAAVAVAERR